MKILFLIVLTLSLNCFSQSDCAKVDMNYSGYCFEFYPNGKTKWIKEFDGRNPIGIWLCFDVKGNLIKQLNTSDKSDSLEQIYNLEVKIKEEQVYGFELTENFHKTLDSIYSFPEIDAKFNGDLNAYIVKKLVYPTCLMDIDLLGRAYIKFVVEIDGAISNVKLIKGIPDCPQCDKEALIVIKAMPAWFPAKNGGKTVRSWNQIPINFSLH